MSSNNKPLIALVTGSNQGIGYWISRNLIQKSNHTIKVLLTCRDLEKGKVVYQEFQKENWDSDLVQLDVTSPQSISDCFNYCKSTYGKIDILINNAGIAINGPDFNHEIFTKTFATNYHAVNNMITTFLPIISENGTIVNVSSMAGHIGLVTEKLQDRFKNATTVQELDQLLNEFDSGITNGNYKELGWPSTAYGTSKLFLTHRTRVWSLDKNLTDKNINIYACCPGYCVTRMTNPNAPRTANQGSNIIVDLALHRVKDQKSGQYYSE